MQGFDIIVGSRKNPSVNNTGNNCKIITIDWESNSSLANACRAVDAIVHAAGMNSIDCLHDPVGAQRTNGSIVEKLLNAALKMGVQRFIYFSTAHVYKSPLEGFISEAHALVNPHPYATSHLAGEEHLLRALSSDMISGCIIRLSNAVGYPTSKKAKCWHLLVNDLASQVVKSGLMTVIGNPKSERDFIAISEVCRVVEFLLIRDAFNEQDFILNVGSGHSLSIENIAAVVAERYKRVFNSEATIIKLKEGRQHQKLVYCINRLERLGIKIDPALDSEIDSLLRLC